MNTIVIPCGSNSSGKTTTLRSLFNITAKKSPSHFTDIKIDGKRVCAVSFCSPQERVQAKDKNNFCKFELVNEDIHNRIAECETNTKDGRTPLLIFKRNRTETYCCLKFSDLLRLVK
jgi:ABC-type cobalamin/Fe3+-siderophores transport system ATPase subunit